MRRFRFRPGSILLVCATIAGPATTGLASEPPEAATEFHSVDHRLSRLIESLLEHNPDLRAARARRLAAVQRIARDRALPDPQLGYRLYLSTPETRVGPQRQGLELTQTVPWSGKRRWQERRAELLAESESWEVRALERGLVADLKTAYFDLAYVHEALAINGEEAALLERFEKATLTRYSTGEGIQQSVVKVQTEITRLLDQRTRLEQRRDALGYRIMALVGEPTASIPLRPSKLVLPSVEIDPGALEREALAGHPAVQAASLRIEADRAETRRRSLDGKPDFSLGLGWTQVDKRTDEAGTLRPPEDNGKDIVALSVRLNLPLRSKRNRAARAGAQHTAASSGQRLQATSDRLIYEVREVILRLVSLEERARLHSEVLIPQAEESLASAESAYRTNRLEFLDLLDAQRVTFQARRSHQRLVADYWIALADVEQAIGRPFPEEDMP